MIESVSSEQLPVASSNCAECFSLTRSYFKASN
jgi:hypothetical protein